MSRPIAYAKLQKKRICKTRGVGLTETFTAQICRQNNALCSRQQKLLEYFEYDREHASGIPLVRDAVQTCHHRLHSTTANTLYYELYRYTHMVEQEVIVT